MNYTPQSKLSDTTQDSLEDCMNFVKFCDKYDMHEVTATAIDLLKGLVRNQDAWSFVKPDDVATLASVLPPDSLVLRILYRVCIKQMGMEYNPWKAGNDSKSPFLRLVKTDDRVALGIMRELQPKMVKENGKKKTVFELPFDPEDYGMSVE